MFFITTMGENGKSPRTVGYLRTFNEAEEVVLKNKYDIYEYSYPYAVIENIPIGIYEFDFNPVWYKWDDVDNSYKKIQKPKFSEGFIGWGIG